MRLSFHLTIRRVNRAAILIFSGLLYGLLIHSFNPLVIILWAISWDVATSAIVDRFGFEDFISRYFYKADNYEQMELSEISKRRSA